MPEGATTSDMPRQAPRKPERPEAKHAPTRQKRRRKLSSPAILVLGLSVPFAHSTQAAELQYARAIGHEFLPEVDKKRVAPHATEQKPSEQLPQLGEAPRQSDTSGSTKTWTKVLIGAVVLGAIAALGNRGDGNDSGAASTGSDGSTGSAPATDPGGGSGTGIGIGGGGISIGGN